MMATSTQVYDVPVVYQQPDSTNIHLMLDALKDVDRVANDIFTRITARVNSNKEKLATVRTRIDAARAKVQKVAGRPKATTVFSPARYPAPKQLNEFESLYAVPPAFSSAKSHFDTSVLPQPERDPFLATLQDPLEKFAQMSESLSTTKHKSVYDKHYGLGVMPKHLKGVPSLMLFNTSENPYKEYVSLDNLAGVTTDAKERQTENIASMLAEAPKTVTEGDALLSGVQALEFTYKPQLGPVPEFSLPTTLPNLPNVADLPWNVAFSDLPIAPTAIKDSALPNLPAPDASAAPPPPPSGANPAGDAPAPGSIPPPPPPPPANMPPPPPPPPGGAPPPPPPPPPPGGAPPPPPPPPGGAPPPPPTGENVPPPPSGGRAALLDAIRNVKGRALKPVGAKRKEKEQAAKAPASKPTDFISDIKNKLSLRRKAISGRKDDEETAPKPAPAETSSQPVQPPQPAEASGVPASTIAAMPHLDAFINSKDKGDGSDDDSWD